jgi:hypothetical protein
LTLVWAEVISILGALVTGCFRRATELLHFLFTGSEATIITSAAYHLFPKYDHAYEMFRGRPNRIKPALETSDTVH